MESSGILRAVLSTLIAAGATTAPPEVEAQSYCSGNYCYVTAQPPGLGGGWAGGGGGGGGWDGNSLPSWCRDAGCNEQPYNYCPTLRMNKPEGCEGPKNVEGAAWGKDRYAFASALYFGIVLSEPDSVDLNPAAKSALQNALAQHTAAISTQIVPLPDANRALINSVIDICEYQYRADMAYSHNVQACATLVAKLNGEATGDYGDAITNFFNRLGVSLSDLRVPQTVVNWLAPENSLRVKFEVVEAQVQCNVWYSEMQTNGC